jgi:hypothetical protein
MPTLCPPDLLSRAVRICRIVISQKCTDRHHSFIRIACSCHVYAYSIVRRVCISVIEISVISLKIVSAIHPDRRESRDWILPICLTCGVHLLEISIGLRIKSVPSLVVYETASSGTSWTCFRSCSGVGFPDPGSPPFSFRVVGSLGVGVPSGPAPGLICPTAASSAVPPSTVASDITASLLATWTPVGRGLRAGLPTVATAPSAVANCPRSS